MGCGGNHTTSSVHVESNVRWASRSLWRVCSGFQTAAVGGAPHEAPPVVNEQVLVAPLGRSAAENRKHQQK